MATVNDLRSIAGLLPIPDGGIDVSDVYGLGGWYTGFYPLVVVFVDSGVILITPNGATIETAPSGDVICSSIAIDITVYSATIDTIPEQDIFCTSTAIEIIVYAASVETSATVYCAINHISLNPLRASISPVNYITPDMRVVPVLQESRTYKVEVELREMEVSAEQRIFTL